VTTIAFTKIAFEDRSFQSLGYQSLLQKSLLHHRSFQSLCPDRVAAAITQIAPPEQPHYDLLRNP